MKRIEKISENVPHQLCNDFDNCSCFSLQLDESTNIKDATKIIAYIWTTKEEVLGIITLKGREA